MLTGFHVLAFDQSRVFRPRLLIHGMQGMGQQYISAALLGKFEGLYVQSFDISVLVADTPNAVSFHSHTEELTSLSLSLSFTFTYVSCSFPFGIIANMTKDNRRRHGLAVQGGATAQAIRHLHSECGCLVRDHWRVCCEDFQEPAANHSTQRSGARARRHGEHVGR